MAEVLKPTGRQQVVWVNDKAGNEFVGPISALKYPKSVTEEVLKNCVNKAKSPQPHAGG